MKKSYKKDIQVLYRINQNQYKIIDAINRCQCNPKDFHNDTLVFDACAFYMAQIGEDIKLLTDNTKQSFQYLDVKTLVYFRNMVDHTYEKVNKQVLKAYIQNMVDNKTIAEIQDRIKYCINAAKTDE